jgi:succinyl-CoA synthetase alpha subunit
MSHKFYKPARSRLQRSELAVPGSSPKMFEKVEILKECGVTISKNPSVMGDTVKSVLKKI